jgi:hypothetical protein
MKVVKNYNLLRKATPRTKILVLNNLSPGNKLRRDLREETIVVMMTKILKNTEEGHNKVRLWKYLKSKN